MANTATEQFQKNKVVCPRKLKHNFFTVAAVDIINVNSNAFLSWNSSFFASGGIDELCRWSERCSD